LDDNSSIEVRLVIKDLPLGWSASPALVGEVASTVVDICAARSREYAVRRSDEWISAKEVRVSPADVTVICHVGGDIRMGEVRAWREVLTRAVRERIDDHAKRHAPLTKFDED
jgi:hypothetical protein